MASTDEEVLERLIQLWNVPPSERSPADRDFRYWRNPGRSPQDVLADLRRAFPESALRGAAVAFFEGTVEAFRKGLTPDRRQAFLAGCLLLLAEGEHGLPLPSEIVRGLVTYFDAGYWYRPVGELASACLTQSEVLDALRDGFSPGNTRSVTLSCLEGLRLYRGIGKRDPSPETREKSLAQVRLALSSLRASEDPAIRKGAEQASRAIA
jgi:hypothetical protein